jgi:hypothetical protein
MRWKAIGLERCISGRREERKGECQKHSKWFPAWAREWQRVFLKITEKGRVLTAAGRTVLRLKGARPLRSRMLKYSLH